MIAVSLDGWTDVVGVALLVIAVAAAVLIDRSAIRRRVIDLRVPVIGLAATVALAVVVVVRFVALA